LITLVLRTDKGSTSPVVQTTEGGETETEEGWGVNDYLLLVGPQSLTRCES